MCIRPAHAGVNPGHPPQTPPASDPPRTCGGEPTSIAVSSSGGVSAPHMRGGTLSSQTQLLPTYIRPAHAGVNRLLRFLRPRGSHPPRTCGGEPRELHSTPSSPLSAPHMRGGTLAFKFANEDPTIRPAHAGVNLGSRPLVFGFADPPRTCGGEPLVCSCSNSIPLSAPHMRG